MNWFQRHLDWSLFLGIVITNLAAFFASYFGFIWISYFIYIIVQIPIVGWYLVEKGRSIWWLFLIIIPFGWIFLLGMENKGRLTKPDSRIRIDCINYYIQELKIRNKHEQLGEEFNYSVLSLIDTPYAEESDYDSAIELTNQYLEYLVNANKTRDNMKPLPQEVLPVYTSWYQATNDEITWLKSLLPCWSTLKKNRIPSTSYIVKLKMNMDNSYKRASRQDSILLKRLHLTPQEIQLFMSTASSEN